MVQGDIWNGLPEPELPRDALDANPPDRIAGVEGKGVPLGRVGAPSGIANAALYLASDMSTCAWTLKPSPSCSCRRIIVCCAAQM